VLVASPSPLALGEALYFHGRLREKGMPLLATIVNRVHPEPARGRGPVRASALPADFKAKLLRLCEDERKVVRAEHRSLRRLEVDLGEPPLRVPEQDADVHDLRGLFEVARALVPE
jgi:anion-transporting  ArsA/GET3 family ATPase